MLAYEDPATALRDKRKLIRQAIKTARSLAGLHPLQQQLLLALAGEQQEVLHRAGYTLPCQAGCSYCCHLRVEAFAHEILLLHQAIDAQPADRREAIAQRLRANAARIATIGTEQHLLTNIPCALLVNDRCSLHDIRPLSCARYHSTDLAACQRAHDDPVGQGDRRPIIPEVDLQGDVLLQAMADALKQARLDHRRYELNTALARLLDEPELAGRWRQGKALLPAKSSPAR
jgi:Fe-S-cluster containining protein